MKLKNKNIVITGGAGFIGSYLIKDLIKDNKVFVYDNLSTGKLSNIEEFRDNDDFYFEEGDLLNKEQLKKFLDPGIDLVFHLAANPDVKIGEKDTDPQFKDVHSAKNLLDVMKDFNINNIAFTSSSVVYGPAKIPTPENHPTNPISIYGASKLSVESFISAYDHTFEMNSWIFRLANIIGEKGHGVIVDFIDKLEENPRELEILGDGSQAKSYLPISECIDAMKYVINNAESNRSKIYNIGSNDLINVTEIADIVTEEMGIDPEKVEYNYTGGIDGRGWKGDVKKMLLDISKLKDLGWEGSTSSSRAVRSSSKSIIESRVN